MVKIGVNFMTFSNPTCHCTATADFPVCTVCTLGKGFFETGENPQDLKYQPI